MKHGFFRTHTEMFKELLMDAAIFVMTLYCIFMLTGCSASGAVTTDNVTAENQSSAYSFTDRELDSSYDESSATKITLSGNSAAVSGNGASFSGKTLTISSEGTYILTGTLDDGQILVTAGDSAKVQIVLNGVTITNSDGPAIYVKSGDKIFVTLAANSSNTLSDTGAAYAAADDNTDGVVFSKSDLCFNGSGSLTINAGYKHGIVSKDDLVMTGGTYNITAAGQGLAGKDCIKIADGSYTINAGTDCLQSDNTEDASKGYIYIQGGTFNLTAGNDGIQAATVLNTVGGEYHISTGGGSANASSTGKDSYNQGWGFGGDQTASSGSTSDSSTSSSDTSDSSTSDSAKGLKAGSSIEITGGTYELDTADDSIHSNGIVTLSGGTFTISSGDDGIHADNATKITGGLINISKSYEGIEGMTVEITGGSIEVNASDDGINAAGGSDGTTGRPGENGFDSSSDNYSITISGGTVTVNADGDGLDANGDLTISGGTVFVNGPTSNNDGALDYDGTGSITGGTLIAAGSSGMAQSLTGGSQACILYGFDSTISAGTAFTLTDSTGKTILSGTPAKNYASLVLSSPELASGGTYTLTAGSQSVSITLDGTSYSNISGMNPGGGGGAGGGQGGGQGGGPGGK
ncbi:MAG: carbohydrate-binding domain-containing protein [Eubacteriaceae bacterium]